MSPSQPQRIVAGKYQLVRPLSQGGMGAVWLAQHLDLDAPVAVKFMRSSLAEDAEARTRFAREAKAAAQIRSPYVVHIYDHGIDEGAPYIVMEYLEGEDLGQRLRREGQLPVEEVVRICKQICKGLRPAHALGVVHRDLKPGNVFLCTAADDMVKLLDFGIAKEIGVKRIVKSEATTTGQLLGSPQYLSPEQARGHSVDQRSDLWSVAVIVFRALTAKRPFDAADMGDLIVRICMDPIPSVAALRPDLDEGIDGFFERALSRQVDERFPDAEAFFKAFAAAARARPSQAGLPATTSQPPASAPSWDSTGSSGASLARSAGGGLSVEDAITRATLPSMDTGARQAGTPSGHTGGTLGATLTSAPTEGGRKRIVRAAALVASLAVVGLAVTWLGWSSSGGSESELPAAASESGTAGSAEAVPSSTAPVAVGGAGPRSEDGGGGSMAAASASASDAPLDAGKPRVRRPYVPPRPPKPKVTATPKEVLPDIGY